MTKTQHKIRLINLGETDWWQTQAVYHALAERMRTDNSDVVILCRPRSPYLCLGYHQIFDEVFDRDACAQLELPVIRRRLGGGATYLDRNQLFYQFIFHKSRAPVTPEKMYAKFLALPVAALQKCGVPAHLVGLNEIEIGEKRIAGIGGGNINEACVVVGNYLFDFDYERMRQVWRVPNQAFGKMAASGLRNRLVTLRELDSTLTFEKIQKQLVDELGNAFLSTLKPDTLTDAETNHTEMVYKKLTSANFLSLHTQNGEVKPMASLKISAREQIAFATHRQNGYLVHGSFRICDGIIHESRLQVEPAGKLRKMEIALAGTPFEAWRRTVEDLL